MKGYNHLFTSRHIRGTTDNLNWFVFTNVDLADVQVVRIRVWFASNDIPDHDFLQAVAQGINIVNIDRGPGNLFG